MPKKIIIYFFALFLFFSILEMGAGLIWPYDMTLRKIMRSSENPRILYELKPNAKIKFEGVFIKIPPSMIEISSQGIRDNEYPVRKDKSKFRIMMLGDSIAFGWGVAGQQALAKCLERSLNKTGDKYEVINFSVPTYNTVQEVETLTTRCLAYDPDLVIFVVTDNDKEPMTNYYYPFSFLKYTPDFIYKSHFITAIMVLSVVCQQHMNNTESAIEKGLTEVDQAINKLVQTIKAGHLKVLFYRGDKPWLREILKKHHLEGAIIGSHISYQAQPWLVIDKVDGHPNVEGHRMMAAEIEAYLKAGGYLQHG